jgi:hypothetical protein
VDGVVAAAIEFRPDHGESNAAPAKAEVWMNWRRLNPVRWRGEFFMAESFRSSEVNPAGGFRKSKPCRFGTGG